MSDCEEYHESHVGEDSEGEEVVFREGAAAVENAAASTAPTASPQMVTKSIRGGTCHPDGIREAPHTHG